MSEYGNCHSRAWSRFVCDGGYLIIRRSPYAASARWGAASALYAPVAFCGVLIQHVSAWVNLLGWLLRWRGFYHVIYAKTLDDPFYEFVPMCSKRRLVFPPPVFRGKWLLVDKAREIQIIESQRDKFLKR